MVLNFILRTGCVLAASMVWSAAKAPGNPAAEGDVAQAIERGAYLTTETTHWQELKNQFPDDEILPLGDAGAVFRTLRNGSRQGVFVIVGDAGSSLDTGQLGYLRKEMGLHGWHTLATQLPPEYQVPIPERLNSIASSAPAEDIQPELRSNQSARDKVRSDYAKMLQAATKQYRTSVKKRLTGAHQLAKKRAKGSPVLLFGVGEVGHWLVWYADGQRVDGLVLVDLPANPEHFPKAGKRLGDLKKKSLILQRAPATWSAHDRLGSAVELHILPKGTEVDLERKIRGWVKRRY